MELDLGSWGRFWFLFFTVYMEYHRESLLSAPCEFLRKGAKQNCPQVLRNSCTSPVQVRNFSFRVWSLNIIPNCLSSCRTEKYVPKSRYFRFSVSLPIFASCRSAAHVREAGQRVFPKKDRKKRKKRFSHGFSRSFKNATKFSATKFRDDVFSLKIVGLQL